MKLLILIHGFEEVRITQLSEAGPGVLCPVAWKAGPGPGRLLLTGHGNPG